VALPNRFSEWHSQQLVKIQLIRIMIGPYTNSYPLLVNIGKHSAQYPVQYGKYSAVICIPLLNGY